MSTDGARVEETDNCGWCRLEPAPPIAVPILGKYPCCGYAMHLGCMRKYISGGFNKCLSCHRVMTGYTRGVVLLRDEAAQRAAEARREELIAEDALIANALEAEYDAEVDDEVAEVEVDGAMDDPEGTPASRVRGRRGSRTSGQQARGAGSEGATPRRQLFAGDRDDRDPVTRIKCIVCRRTDDHAHFLLCDNCVGGAHTHCAGLGSRVPKGAWLCPRCRPPPSPNALRLRRLRKKRAAAMGVADFRDMEARRRRERRARARQREF